MSNSIQIAGATFSNVLTSLTLPNREALMGEYVFGGSQASSIKNRANPSLPLTVVGTPTYTPRGAVTTSGTNGFQTGISPGTECTLLLIRKRAATTGFVVPLGDDTVSGTTYGLTEYAASNYYYNSVGRAPSAAYPQLAAPAVGAQYFMQAGVSKQGGVARLYQYAAGVQSFDDATSANNRIVTSIRIGGGSGSDAGVGCEVAYAAIFDRAMTAAEIDAAYVSLSAYYASIGTLLF